MQKSPQAIKVILADDHELFRDGFAVMLKKQPDIELIAEAENGERLLHLTHELQPEVVVTDIKMPKVDGIEVMKRMKKEFPHIGVIALTNYNEESLLVEMLEAGAKGFLLKSANKEEIVDAIKKVYHEKTAFCQQTNAKLAQLIANSKFQPYRRKKKAEFNEREKTIVQLICKGFTNKEIAAQLFLSKRTIESNREVIMEKMEVESTAGLICYAISHAIYQP